MKGIFTCLLFLLASGLFAGSGKDTIQLQEVVKVERLSGGNMPDASPFTDLKYKEGERLSDALGEFSSIYVKNYGSGGLASVAIRGTSAEETEVQWNGIKLNSPSLGQVDLALFLVGMQDELQLVRTGYEGTIGGILRMNNDIKLDSGLAISGTFRAGSFNTYDAMLNAQYAAGKFAGATKFAYLTSQNNFLYRNTYEAGNPYVRQTNANVHQLSFLQQFNAKINRNNELEFYVWLIDAVRQIPPIMSTTDSKQSQDDYSFRAMVDWKAHIRKLKLQITSAWLNDKMHYMDPNALIDETSITYALRNKLNLSYTFPFNLALNGEVNYDYEQADITEYGAIKRRETVGIKGYADYYLSNNFRFHAGFREDLVDTKLSAFAPELAFNYLNKIKERNVFSAGIMASRNFRFPTLNDLYWNPGGNPNLQEEKSWNGEIHAKYAYGNIVDVSVTNFYIYVDNWIQWVPEGSIWMPENFRRVFSRGVEGALHLTNADGRYPNRFVVDFNGSYTFTMATNLDASSAVDQSGGKQLIYVPYNNVITGLQFEYRKFYLRVTNNYTGLVYTSTDNSQYLNGYFITNVEAGKDFVIRHLDLGVSFRVNNVANVQYQVVASRPMAGRNFEGTIRFKFFR